MHGSVEGSCFAVLSPNRPPGQLQQIVNSHLSGISSVVGVINFMTTVCTGGPGMTTDRLALFV